jgi:hypothetical protein
MRAVFRAKVHLKHHSGNERAHVLHSHLKYPALVTFIAHNHRIDAFQNCARVRSAASKKVDILPQL